MSRRPVAMILLLLLLFGIVGCGGPTGSSSATPTADTSQGTPTATPLHVKSVVTSVSPNTLASVGCGHSTDFTFSTVISVDEGSNGGALPYTWNIGSQHIPGTVTFVPSEMSKTVTYTLKGVSSSAASSVSGSLSLNNAGVTMTSTPAAVSGICSFAGKFQIVGLTIAVNPSSVTGIICDNYISFYYTATVTVSPNTNGGTVVLKWNFSATPVTLTFGPYVPGQTTRTVSYTLTGKVIHNQNFPPNGSISSSLPNVMNAGPVKPYGPCVP
ncbi:MAG: hypothetical protein NVS4B7_08940 [Ktedonobacteraceae bacterium]